MTRKGFIIFIILTVIVTMLLSIGLLFYAKNCALKELEGIQTYDLKLKEDFINVYTLEDYTIQPGKDGGVLVVLKRGNVTATYNYDNDFNFVSSNIDAYITSCDSIIIISSVIFCMVLGICIPFTYIGLKYARFKDPAKSSD